VGELAAFKGVAVLTGAISFAYSSATEGSDQAEAEEAESIWPWLGFSMARHINLRSDFCWRDSGI